MRPKRNDWLLVTHMLEAVGLIEQFTAGIEAENFFTNELIKSGTAYQLQIIGEAVSHLNPVTKDAYPGVAWRDIKAMRNILAHEYWSVDFLQIWKIVQLDLPALKETLTLMMESLPKPQTPNGTQS